MTWPFENDTSAITKKLAKKSLQSEKRRNLMVVIAVALAAFLICFTGIVSTSLTQMQRNQVVDTYEAVWLGVEENDIETLKGLPEFERVGGYYMLDVYKRQVLTRGQLLEKLWDIDERFVDEHTLTTSISRIRSKIEADGGVPYIKTVYGMGYQ